MDTISIDDVDNMEEEEQVKEQIKEVKEEPMTDSDTDSNTYSEKVSNFNNLNDSLNNIMPDSQSINYLNETQRLTILTGDESVLQNHLTNCNETQQGLDQLTGDDLTESVMDEDQKTITDFLANTNFPSDDDEEEEEKKEKEGCRAGGRRGRDEVPGHYGR